ncbi:MAG: NlpC/P60 family protein [Lachnospiraceae bacterium]
MKKRLLQTLITVTVMSSLVVTPVLATPQDDVKSLEQKKSQAEAEAESVNEELVSLLVDYDALQTDIKNQGKRIEEAESDLKDAEAKEKKQYEDMKLRIKYMYEEGDTSFFETLITAKSFSDLVNKAEYVQKVHDYDRHMLDEYVKTKNEVKDLKASLEEGQAEMESMSDEMKVQKANLETTLTDMRSKIDDFDSQLTQAKAAAEEELKRIEAEQKAAEAAEMALASANQTSDNKADAQDSGTQNSQQTSNSNKNESKPSSSSGSSSSGNSSSGSDSGSSSSGSSSSGSNSGSSSSGSSSSGSNSGSSSSGSGESSGSSGTSNASLGQQIANEGCKYIGNKYVYGGNSLTNGIDCSGFVQQIHKIFGISTPRTSTDIRTHGKSVSYADKMPGDVICYSGHVAIYIGNNQIVHASNSAPYPKGGIKISSPANYRTVLAVRRYW